MPNLEMRVLTILCLGTALAGCVSSSPNYIPGGPPQASRPAPQVSTPPPMRPATTPQTTATQEFRAAEVMRAPGLEGVIGATANELERRFGNARLRVSEGDALKLQFSGEPCVLDVYLYPARPGAAPSATHVEARRASDGRPVDRASCVAALRGS
ncbi:hypothetical protein [Altererythrobacter sp. GH1-8]|uniref:hypothetical protein n=1 Tax=Altererythrobacter sp. GH1-8 TaxID=3349333 RepID=UPI00374D63ED